jgi:nucleolar protein 9
MPRENRKRGKKTKKVAEDTTTLSHAKPAEETVAQPSWILPAQKGNLEITSDAPFGIVDADIKAYFRTVDIQIRDWQEHEGDANERAEDIDPNEGT